MSRRTCGAAALPRSRWRWRACGEKPQTIDAHAKKVDAKSWEASNSPYVAQGWKTGDKTSWDEQMRARAQAQNEYARTNAA